jgi:molecular chaperone GrpE
MSAEEKNFEQENPEIEQAQEAVEAAETPQAEQAPDYPVLIAELNDKILRMAAEMQNVRRRTDLDIQKAKHFAVESFARDLLSVMDSLTRASDSISEEDAVADARLKSLKDGVEITRKELNGVFERNHIKRVGAVGDKFDANLHQPMVQLEQADKPSGTIADVMQSGYLIRDRLLRPALVAVVK